MKARQTFKPYTLQFNTFSATPIIAAAFPNVLLLDTITFQEPLELLGFDLNASFFSIEPGPTNVAGIFLVVGTAQAELGLSETVQLLGSVLCAPLASSAIANPPSPPVFFDEDFCVKISPGYPVSLYGCNAVAQTRINGIAALANIYMG